MHNENNERPQKKESLLARMQRRGALVIQPPKPGDLDVLAKLREARAYVPEDTEPKGEIEP